LITTTISESLGELEKAVKTLAYSLCSHSISVIKFIAKFSLCFFVPDWLILGHYSSPDAQGVITGLPKLSLLYICPCQIDLAVAQ